MTKGEKELILQASRGDVQAIGSLMEEYLPGLQAFLHRKAGSLVLGKESSADLAQSVCRDILENLDRFQYGGNEGFRSWLYATATRKIADRYEFYQAQKRSVHREEKLSPTAADLFSHDQGEQTPSRHVEAKEELCRFEQAFKKLPDEQREAIHLARFIGLNRKEMAARMNKSEGAVRTLLSRALANLADKLDPGDPGEGRTGP